MWSLQGITFLSTVFSSDGQRVLLSDEVGEEIWSVVPEPNSRPEVLLHQVADWGHGFRVHSGRLFFSVSEYESDIWVVDLECAVCGNGGQ